MASLPATIKHRLKIILKRIYQDTAVHTRRRHPSSLQHRAIVNNKSHQSKRFTGFRMHDAWVHKLIEPYRQHRLIDASTSGPSVIFIASKQ